ncbi:retrotransposon protein, putative, ty1-copia subclass [Tanacetum coccineum]
MAASMSPELQKTFENTWAYEMNQQLKEMFQAKASKERLDVMKSLMACKPKPGASIYVFVLEMKWYFDRLESLNMAFDAELSINMILSGLPADYNQFVLSYQMNGKETSVMKLHSLLQTAEHRIKKSDVPSTSAAPVLNVGHNAKKRKTSHSNWKGKATQGKSDRGSKRKVDYEIAPTGDPKEAVCFYCNTKGHWKCICPKYLKDLKDGKGLKKSRKLKHGELNLVIGNRKITPVTKIGKYELMLKSGVRINLNNCCYSSEMTRNIISFHALFKDGYQFSFDNENGDILVYSNGCFVFKASPCKGIYETVECIDNGNVILNVGSSNELDKSKLWHSRLGHINKKRIAQLQKDGVLESFDFKSDDVCESCLLGKMTKSPFTRTCERGEGLLDLVHTDVCGPFRSATKDGKRYYVTFTDDFSRYGYVYLIKHKSDTFEMFKRYQNEVENQLGRKIKLEEELLEREMISKEDSGSKIDLEEIQESADEEPIVNTNTQQKMVTPVEPDDISLPIRKTSSTVSKPPQESLVSTIVSIMKDDKISDIWNLVDTHLSFKEWWKVRGILQKKIDMDGKVHTYKASSFHDYEICQKDVKTDFLNGKLTEDVFMAQPEGFENEKYPKRVCKLQKAIYGLKHASRS